MDAEICKNFLLVREKFPDQLNSDGKYTFKDEYFKDYCTGGCDNDFKKINAGCLYFFDAFFKDSSLFEKVAKNNINIVDYIIIWLSYMLSLMESELKESLVFFYNIYIKGGERYTNTISGINEYSSYMELISKKHDLTNVDMNKSIISELYDAFKILCEMYTEFDKNSNCTSCSEKAKEFVKKYEQLNGNYSITGNSSYNKMLSSLSTDYNKLKDKYKDSSSLPAIKSTQITSSSSIANNLLLVLSIFGAIGIFLGIAYKYSLFGFRKRFKKQQIREKLKNIKKKMNQ
ncbi:PIR protein [Plasmodium yoelii]|uniref:PIR protein n=2 Tax=Plasmodium yoelii TaxID=5861 RepID=A0AAE9WLY6_PLAYO|nr:PIR protein [Plasmodium yoelii]WBY56508.1 PIR protein [Plasmodium yoelii yoelii]VTZ77018.1 PIR protein [Plasmodium yoelii]|eukprot:XP_022811873.1 PIR protein [Plasmodium yoelii]